MEVWGKGEGIVLPLTKNFFQEGGADEPVVEKGRGKELGKKRKGSLFGEEKGVCEEKIFLFWGPIRAGDLGRSKSREEKRSLLRRRADRKKSWGRFEKHSCQGEGRKRHTK